MDFKKSIAIVGAGPAGCMCAYFASKNADVTLFDFSSPLTTLLYTGGGRCNLAHAEYDFRELVKFYPRGEKFLYSVFSQFCTGDTIDFFENIGVKTYTQDDFRIFPVSNSAKEVRDKFLYELKHCGFKKEKVVGIKPLSPNPSPTRGEGNDSAFSITTERGSYDFDAVVIAVGGHAGFSLAKNLGHKIVEPKPALTGLITKENFKPIQGVSLKNITAEVAHISHSTADGVSLQDDMIFTHDGISGPLAYKISSICAREDYSRQNPLLIKLNLIQDDLTDDDLDLQSMLNSNPKKDIKNLVSELVPKSLAEYILKLNNISLDEKCCNINGKTRDLILKSLTEFEVNVISPAKDGEVVTSGGVCLDEINPKTMQSKLVDELYFCGEVIDVDGFCGGFNLQNCWSTGFVAGNSL